MHYLALSSTERYRAARALPRWKKLLFGMIAAILVLSLLEFLLFVLGVKPVIAYKDPFVGFDANIPHFERRGEIGEPIKLRTAHNKLAWLNNQEFAATKQEGAYRMFCLGGSTTFGRPYDDKTSFCGWLRELLTVAYPEGNWEVVNAGGVSYASYRVAALMEELVAYEPDLFIVYTGHNEFLEERTYGDVRTQSPAQRWLTTAATRTRIRAAFHRLLAVRESGAPWNNLPTDFETVLDNTIGPTSYVRDDDLRKNIAGHYELSLDRMVTLAHSAGAEIVFVRPACKLLHCAPFKSVPSDQFAGEKRCLWHQQLQQGQSHLRDGDYAKALEVLSLAAKADDRSAELHYLIGETLFASGQYEEANAALIRAVDEDVCPLRMTSDLGTALDRVAQRRRVVTVDFARLLRGDCLRRLGHPILGSDYFLDHVHPTIEAHGLLAQELAERLWELTILPGRGDLTRGTLDQVERLVHAGVDPVAHAQAEAHLACVHHWAGKTNEAGLLALRALERFPEDPRIWLIAGIYLKAQGEHERAEAHLRQALRISPNDPRIHKALEDWNREGANDSG